MKIERMHTVEHVLLQVLKRRWPSLKTRALQFGEERVRLDYVFQRQLSEEELRAVEEEVNAVIEQGLPVKWLEVPRSEAEKLCDLGLVPAEAQKIQIVAIGGFDYQPCISRHVQNTKDIGAFTVLTGKKVGKDTYRVYFTVSEAEEEEKLVLVVPSKGRLSVPALAALRGLGVETSGRSYLASGDGVQVALARARDVPLYVEKGFADAGITGRDLVAESQADVSVVRELGFGSCRLVLAAKQGTLEKDIKRIATCFPNLAKKFVAGKGLRAEVLSLDGAIELSVSLGLADAIIDLTGSGQTLKDNGLVVLEELMASEAVLIANKGALETEGKKIMDLAERIAGEAK